MTVNSGGVVRYRQRLLPQGVRMIWHPLLWLVQNLLYSVVDAAARPIHQVRVVETLGRGSCAFLLPSQTARVLAARRHDRHLV